MKLYSISKRPHICLSEYHWILSKFGMKVTNDIKEADFCYLGGGADVSPEFYLPYNISSHASVHTDYQRDLQEIPEAKYAIEKGIPIFGTCRGAQLLCVLAGGVLVQHQKNPDYIHKMKTAGEDILVTSTHHQAQYPFGLNSEDYLILGHTENYVQERYLNANEKASQGLEVEVCFYPKINALAAQPHFEAFFPERTEGNINSLNWIAAQVEKYLLKR